MAYKETIPQPTDKKNISQADLLNNFAALKLFTDVDHLTMNEPINYGKHNYATFRKLTPNASTPKATIADEVAIYNKGNALVYRPQNKAAGDIAGDIDFTTATLAASGYCRLPCGLKAVWGTGALGINVYTITIPFVSAFAAVPFATYVSPNTVVNNNAFEAVVGATSTAANITINRDSHHMVSAIGVYFLVIGI